VSVGEHVFFTVVCIKIVIGLPNLKIDHTAHFIFGKSQFCKKCFLPFSPTSSEFWASVKISAEKEDDGK
jgi:hypothetical protein